jgi:hypothetical protein
MQVRATQRGFLYWVRHPGEVFEIAEHLFSKEWMEKIESTDDAAKAAEVNPVAPPPPVADIAASAGPTATAAPNLEAAADSAVLAPKNEAPLP